MRGHSLKTKIMAVTIGAIIVTMIIATVLGAAAIRKIGISSSEQALLLLCEAGQKNLDSCLLDAEQDVEAISAYVESNLDGLDNEKLQAHLDRVSDFFKRVLYKTNGVRTYYYRIDPAVSSDVKGFWFVNTDGEGFQEHEVTDITQYDTDDTSHLIWFTVPKATGKPVWLPPYITENLDERVISYNTPVYLDGRFVGVIGIELDYSFMAGLVDNITLYENGYAFVNDAEGKLIYHPRMDVAAMETPPTAPEGVVSDNTIIRYHYEGEDKMAVSLPLCNGDRLVVSVPLSEISAGWQREIIIIAAAFSVLLLAFILFMLRFTGKITKPLQDLTKVAEEIGEGNYDHTIEYDGDDEIGVLTRTFNRVSADLKENITELHALNEQLTLQKESLSTLLNNMPALNFSKDAQTGTYLYCNQGFAEYANKDTPEGVVGLTDFEIFDPETAKHFTEDDRKALSMDIPHVFFEDVKDAEGKPRQFQTTKMKFYDSSGRMCLLGMCMDVTELERVRKEREHAEEERKSYVRLRALSGNLIVLFYIDPKTEEYTEFSSSKEFKDLGIERQGSDFFRIAMENSLKMVHPDDLALFRAQATKENILTTIARDGVFVLAFRLMSKGELPSYARLKAAIVEEDGKELLIIALLDEDAQIRQEMEYARDLSVAKKMATVDSLTGVKNKHVYAQWEEQIDDRIKKQTQEPFAVVVCDVNNLKAVNDLYGHKEGDECIQKACRKICTVFDHSPVFRIGGDEFVVLLTGGDYARRVSLMEQINALPADRTQIRIGETIAAGMVEYDKNRHFSLLSVFEEADKAMYDKKQFLKEHVLSRADDDRPDTSSAGEEIIPVNNMRKCILVADDIEMNREILGDLLSEDYDILYACDGAETLEQLRGHKEEIDLVLLDLIMPNMSGREVIAEMQVDEDLMSIPVIILTVDQDAEIDCLKIGAMDFIPKPYPDIEIVKARIDKCIELSEDRDLIRHTERDKLTGLFNRDYFFRYVSRLDQIYRGSSLDALAFDVNRFHSVNKHYGRQFGDLVLHRIGIALRKLARETGGIGCRQGGDTFLLYCPHQYDYEALLRKFMSDVFDKETENKVSLRIGVFTDAQQEPEIEERFSRAAIAADRVKDNPDAICGFYAE